jgi:GRAM domain-containing protein 4
MCSYYLPTRRLPPAFNEVPTDVEYAMALISQRVAAGLEIKPIKRDGLNQRGTIIESLLNENTTASETQIDWKRLGRRIALGKSAVSAITRLNPVRRNTV